MLHCDSFCNATTSGLARNNCPSLLTTGLSAVLLIIFLKNVRRFKRAICTKSILFNSDINSSTESHLLKLKILRYMEFHHVLRSFACARANFTLSMPYVRRGKQCYSTSCNFVISEHRLLLLRMLLAEIKKFVEFLLGQEKICYLLLTLSPDI